MRWFVVALALSIAALLACGGDIEKENVATTNDAGSPSPIDGASPTLDATTPSNDGGGGSDGGVVIYDGGAPCATNSDCNGGTCFQGMCMCQLPKYVQPDGRCGDTPPPDCMTAMGTCRQNPAQCNPGELEADLDTNMSCGDFIAASCCFSAASCKTTIDFECCGASTTPYEPTCVNGWRTCNGGGPTAKPRTGTCP